MIMFSIFEESMYVSNITGKTDERYFMKMTRRVRHGALDNPGYFREVLGHKLITDLFSVFPEWNSFGPFLLFIQYE